MQTKSTSTTPPISPFTEQRPSLTFTTFIIIEALFVCSYLWPSLDSVCGVLVEEADGLLACNRK